MVEDAERDEAAGAIVSVASTKHWAFMPVAALVAFIDQVGKWHAMRSLDVGERVAWLGDLLALAHLPAASGALGLFSGWPPSAQLGGFAVLSLIAVTIIVSFYRGLAPGEHGSAAALGAILGGIASNGLDRFRHGAGLDFLHLGSASSESLPDFNFADVAIVMGVVTLIVELLATEMAARASERPGR
ncbi:MAG: signal peptidase II [Myxococcota bacterium]